MTRDPYYSRGREKRILVWAGPRGKRQDPIRKITKLKTWGKHGTKGRAPAWQALDPEFKLQYHTHTHTHTQLQKKKKNTRK
jgi:hypothetical protein